jgi:hypothetical protein
MGTGRNRLARERSAYLRGAAEQPVDWHPWSEEAFARAKAEDKPILLDIGAVWCHWCHVLDRESYEDRDTAAMINQLFVAVKVDRDERPDVDARYQQAVQALSGQGGWPLTAFLTPDGEVFYGGTYFPPKEALGRPSFRRVLSSVAKYYRDEKEKAVAEARSLHQALAERHVHASPGELTAKRLESAEDQVGGSFDAYHGGFGSAPKFPHTGTVEFLLARFWRSRDPFLKSVIERTLEGMARGGIHDQLGGGFHRYSVDAKWIVPHFEKMAYDNAELLRNYVHGYQLLGTPGLRDTAAGILRWVGATLSDQENGGFYGSQDADMTLEDDGDYYTWSLKEVRTAVSPDEATVLALHYNIGEIGEMRESPDRNVLFVDKGVEDIAKGTGIPRERVESLLESGRSKLLESRARRKGPTVDRAIYANWNGMFISAYLEAWRGLGSEPAKAFALKTLDRLLRELYVQGEGFYHQLVDGQRRVRGLLDDQVQMMSALLEAYEATGTRRYLEVAKELHELLLLSYWDPAEGGLFDTADRALAGEVAAVSTRRRPIEDNPTPSSNAVAAMAFAKLGHFTGHEVYLQNQEASLRAFAGEAGRYGGIYCGTYFQALDLFLNPPSHVVIVGDEGDAKAEALHRAALGVYSPGKTVLRFTAAERDRMPELVRPMLDAPEARKGAAAFVCHGTVCLPPTSDPAHVKAALARPS